MKNRTADVALFAPLKDRWQVLLIRRGHEPYLGCWAFPGGFLEDGESAEVAARRELREETGISFLGALKFIGHFDAPGRDPRGPTESDVYAAVLEAPRTVTGDDDAAEAAWHPLDAVPRLAFDHQEILAAALTCLSDVLRRRAHR